MPAHSRSQSLIFIVSFLFSREVLLSRTFSLMNALRDSIMLERALNDFIIKYLDDRSLVHFTRVSPFYCDRMDTVRYTHYDHWIFDSHRVTVLQHGRSHINHRD